MEAPKRPPGVDGDEQAAGASLDEEIMLRVNVEAKVEDLIEDIVDGVREIMSV